MNLPMYPLSPKASTATDAPRPSYAGRRQAQIAQRVALWAAGTPPIKKGIEALFTECRGPKMKGVSRLLRSRATRFTSKEEAEAANAYFKRERGHTEAVVFCEKCSAWHLRHIYSSELLQRKKAPEPKERWWIYHFEYYHSFPQRSGENGQRRRARIPPSFPHT